MIHKLLSAKPRFWLFIFLFLTVLFITVHFSQKHHLQRQAQNIAALQAERLDLVQTNADIQHKIDFTFTDEYIEREAHGKLRLVKQGEILFESLD